MCWLLPGTTHGIYTKKPKLDLERITKIKEAIDIPFVHKMHGGSGLSKEEFQDSDPEWDPEDQLLYIHDSGRRKAVKALDRRPG